MKSRLAFLSLIFILLQNTVDAQLLHEGRPAGFTRADSLRGYLSPLRTCFDVTFYNLDVRVDPDSQAIRGTNTIRFKVVETFEVMQIDLFANMNVEKILLDDGSDLSFKREHNAIFISLPRKLRKGTSHAITISYSGKPLAAARPPWEGGFIWRKDKEGNPWIAVACQGTGASSWWPNKDHQSDEPDSMLISITVPPGLMNISNGRLRKTTVLANGWTKSDWFVANPINNYNVSVNIGKYAHFADQFVNGDTLALDYYVMPYNLEKAKRQFEQVKPMLACFEHHFGKYPFAKDGFKLIETPYLGMEHQSAIAYGNNYLQGYNGTATSEIGLSFDFIIIHESAHEWWGNSVTANDIADMWIHESFGAYAEAVYVEYLHGYEKALSYINGKKKGVLNLRPIIGVRGVNKEGAKDMYNKGQLALNTLRHVINNDSLWWKIIKGLATEFRHKNIDGDDIFRYINKMAKSDLTPVFDQYFRHANLPYLEMIVTKKGSKTSALYRWKTDVEAFAMPVKVTVAKDVYEFIYPTTSWKTSTLKGIDPAHFRVAEDKFYLDLNLTISYVDPNKLEMSPH